MFDAAPLDLDLKPHTVPNFPPYATIQEGLYVTNDYRENDTTYDLAQNNQGSYEEPVPYETTDHPNNNGYLMTDVTDELDTNVYDNSIPDDTQACTENSFFYDNAGSGQPILNNVPDGTNVYDNAITDDTQTCIENSFFYDNTGNGQPILNNVPDVTSIYAKASSVS